ncbi:MAG: ABC transporter substrate-binding protein, partial [Spirochaetota bacterium]
QKAHVFVDSYPDKTFTGKVVAIANKPEFTPKTIQTKEERVKLVFAVKIAIDNSGKELKPGMPADAVILTGEQ